MDDKILPISDALPPTETPESLGVPSAKAQSWGAVISIVVIVLMVVIGAFYAWGERVSQNNAYPAGLVNPTVDDSNL